MKINSLNQVYVQPQAKAVKEKQNNSVKINESHQNNFSPALMLSANLNKVSFGKYSEEDRRDLINIAKANPKKIVKFLEDAEDKLAKAKQEKTDFQAQQVKTLFNQLEIENPKKAQKVLEELLTEPKI